MSNQGSKIAELKSELLLMEKDRKDLEEKIKDQQLILDTNNIDMTESLTDKDDYPRQDIDVWAVRNARATITRLQNDAKSLFVKMSEKLQELHSLARDQE